MKTLSITLATLLACCAAQAATNEVEVHGHALQRLSSSEAAELQGRYALTDGRVLEVSRRGARLTVALDGQEQMLLATAPLRLQSADGLLLLDIDAAANGSVRGLTLTQAGHAPVATIRPAPRA